MSDLLIRPLTEGDLGAIKALRLESLLDAPEAFGTTYEQALAWDVEQWRTVYVGPLSFGAFLGDRLVGQLRGGHHEHRPGCWLWGMYVTPSARGTGAADALVSAVVEWAVAEGAEDLRLFVNPAAVRAQAFYSRYGFHACAPAFVYESKPFQEMVLPLRAPVRVRHVAPEELYELRRRILRGNDPTADASDPRDHDDTARHYGGFDAGVLVASASTYPATSPFDPSARSAMLRYVAVDDAQQGRGVGRALLEVVLDELVAEGYEEVWANARDTALAFYRATGWTVVEGTEHSSPYTGLPHTQIRRRLVDAVVG